MKYDFDKVIDRLGTYSVKWDLATANNRTAIPMMIADMDLPSPEPVVQAMHRVADHMMYGYSLPYCTPEYFTSLCRWFKDRHDWDIKAEEIIPSQGTFGALTYVAQLYAQEGEGIILMNPVYGHFAQDVQKWNRKVVFCHLINDNGYYTIDFEKLEALCAEPNNKVLIFCSPANPVGRVWNKEELTKVYEITKKYHVFVISDEVHCDHLRKDTKFVPYLTVCEDKGNAISLVGINKTFNMAGLACSNAIVQDKTLREKIMEHYPMPMATPFAIAGQIAAYTEGDEWMDQVCDYMDGNIDWAIDYFKQTMPKVKIWRPEGTYFLWMDFRAYGLTDEEIHKRIYEDANVILQDGMVHDPEQGQCFQRMVVACARSVLQAACERINAAFADVK